MRLVVVGGVAAGLSAASRARRADRSLEITVLERGERISYGACGLPYFIEGQVRSLDELTVYTPEFFERERDIRIRTGAEVVAVQHPRREVVLASGDRVRYDRLVWAAGARAARPWDHPKVFVLHTDRDAARLASFLTDDRPKTAAVIGGGYIGLEMVTALRARGLAVTLFSDTTDLLQRQDPWLTQLLLERLRSCRVEVRLNEAIRDAASLPHDLVLASTGLKPNVDPLATAGAELGRSGALAVSDRQETSLGSIWAAGDCAEACHVVTGRSVWIPLGTTANKAGRVAGANAAGVLERFDGVAGTSIVRVAGLAVSMTGLSEAQARREGFRPVAARIEARDRAKYFHGRRTHVELVADQTSSRLLGGTVVGDGADAGRINVIAAALHARLRVDQFSGLDLAYAPPYAPVLDPLLLCSRRLIELLD
jgi:NADPH-dependent 2,4-dienoyl-CoA reductase/sulfur reductase-like enzyme